MLASIYSYNTVPVLTYCNCLASFLENTKYDKRFASITVPDLDDHDDVQIACQRRKKLLFASKELDVRKGSWYLG